MGREMPHPDMLRSSVTKQGKGVLSIRYLEEKVNVDLSWRPFLLLSSSVAGLAISLKPQNTKHAAPKTAKKISRP